jgi:hypothetical protein
VRRPNGDVRYQCKRDEDLFVLGGSTWVLTNQFGAQTAKYVRSMAAELPELAIDLRGETTR